MSDTIRVIGNTGFGSGYKQAAKNIFECFENSKLNCIFQDKQGKVSSVKGSVINPDKSFHITAPPFGRLYSSYNIAYFYWETDTLPVSWRREIHLMNEIWSPCNLVTNCLKKIGYKGLIRHVPTPSQDKKNIKNLINFKIENDMVLDDSCFKFYSIFQWNYRKGYDILIKSYLEEFSENENVILILKTNPLYNKNTNFTINIKKFISGIKSKIKKKNFPKIIISTEFFSNLEIDALHESGDCFVLPHRGEGWGMPIARAIQYDNHVITTKFGGVTDYLNDSNANIIKHNMAFVQNMSWTGLYKSSQKWAEPCPDSLKENMRQVFSQKDYSKILNRLNVKRLISKENFINAINDYL